MRRIILTFLFMPVLIEIAFVFDEFENVSIWGVIRNELIAMYLILFVVGIPSLLYMVKRKWLSLWHFILLGAVSTSPFLVLYLSVVSEGFRKNSGLAFFVSYCVFGMLLASLFWFFAIWKNPRVQSYKGKE